MLERLNLHRHDDAARRRFAVEAFVPVGRRQRQQRCALLLPARNRLLLDRGVNAALRTLAAGLRAPHRWSPPLRYPAQYGGKPVGASVAWRCIGTQGNRSAQVRKLDRDHIEVELFVDNLLVGNRETFALREDVFERVGKLISKHLTG